jgi:hypothetical protein
MVRRLGEAEILAEGFLAELTDAAYRVALRHGIKGSFIDVELDLWQALRQVLHPHDSHQTSRFSEEVASWRP